MRPLALGTTLRPPLGSLHESRQPETVPLERSRVSSFVPPPTVQASELHEQLRLLEYHGAGHLSALGSNTEPFAKLKYSRIPLCACLPSSFFGSTERLLQYTKKLYTLR